MKAKTKSDLNYLYDQEADVLYISKGKPSKYDISDEIGDDVVARFDPKTREVRGLTIINFAARTRSKARNIKLPFDIKFTPLQ